ncbi:MAG: N-acetyl sugar amidotransferase [Granulosicoccus sp.]
MKYCKRCLATDLRPNSSFKNGVCIACEYSDKNISDQKKSGLKLALLKQSIKRSRGKLADKKAYDCIVGVSGGKDSTRQAHWVRDRLGLRPLLICCSYPPRQMSEIGAQNLSNLISLGFDLINATPAPKTAQKLALESFLKFGNICKATEMSLFATVPRLAISLNVNTIFWGENPALQVGDSAVEGIDEFDGNNLRNLNTLTDGGNKWLKSAITEPYKADHYYYPEQIEFERKKINIIYLGPAWDDWSNENNSTYAALNGLTLRPEEELETGDISNASMLDEEFSNINMMLKYFKFGFGRTTDMVNEQIRINKITRQDGIEIVKKYDGICSDRIIREFSDYVGIEVSRFWQVANSYVNQELFEVQKSGRPIPRFSVGEDYVC